MAIKFLAPNGAIITIKTDPKEVRQCYMQSLKVNPYSLKSVREQATQTEEIQVPLAKCHNVEIVVKQEVPRRSR